MKKIIIISIIFLIGISYIGGLVIIQTNKENKNIGKIADIHPLQANISSTDEVGPQENVRIVATSTNRVALTVMSTGSGDVPVYCEAAGDNDATSGEGIMLATSTSMIYEWTFDKGNLFGGALSCTATASTTVLIQQFLGK